MQEVVRRGFVLIPTRTHTGPLLCASRWQTQLLLTLGLARLPGQGALRLMLGTVQNKVQGGGTGAQLGAKTPISQAGATGASLCSSMTSFTEVIPSSARPLGC